MNRSEEHSVKLVQHYQAEFPRIYKGEPWLGPSLLKILKEITAEQAFSRPLEQAHNIAELLTHIVSWKEIVLNRLRKSGKPRPKQAETFDPRRFGNNEEEIWENLLNLLETQNREFSQFLDELAKNPAKARRASFRQINGILQHDIYHMGQIAILKKAVR